MENSRTVVYYNFRRGSKQEYVDQLTSTFRREAMCSAPVISSYNKFNDCRRYILEEDRESRPTSTVV